MALLSGQLAVLQNKTIPNPIANIQQQLEDARFPTSSEPMLNHPFNNSVVKIRDNGAIDIFAQGHQGIRVDPQTASINLCANTLKEHLGALRTWITKDAKIVCGTGFDLKSHAFVKVHANGAISISTDTNLDLIAKGNMNLSCGGWLSIKSGGNHSVIAGGDITQVAGKPNTARLTMAGGEGETVIDLSADIVNA